MIDVDIYAFECLLMKGHISIDIATRINITVRPINQTVVSATVSFVTS